MAAQEQKLLLMQDAIPMGAFSYSFATALYSELLSLDKNGDIFVKEENEYVLEHNFVDGRKLYRFTHQGKAVILYLAEQTRFKMSGYDDSDTESMVEDLILHATRFLSIFKETSAKDGKSNGINFGDVLKPR